MNNKIKSVVQFSFVQQIVLCLKEQCKHHVTSCRFYADDRKQIDDWQAYNRQKDGSQRGYKYIDNSSKSMVTDV